MCCHGYCHSTKQKKEGMCTNHLFSEDGIVGLLELAVAQLTEVCTFVTYQDAINK